MSPKIQITLLGEFKVIINDTVIIRSDGKPGRNWEVFAILALARSSPLPTEQLIGFLWPDDVSVNPQNALKNAIYCLRRDINSICESDVDIILYTQGKYQLAPYVDVTIDIETIESLYRLTIFESIADDTRVKHYKRIIELYASGPVDAVSNHPYADTWTTRLKKMVLSAYSDLARIYAERDNFELSVTTARQGIQIDSCSTELHHILLASLGKLSRHDLVINEFHRMCCIFEENLVDVDDTIEEVYLDSLRCISTVERDITLIKAELRASIEFASSSKRAYFCTYEIFKHICNIKCRDATRVDRLPALILINIRDQNDDDIANTDVNEAAMQELKLTMSSCLRKGDIFTRYSSHQFIIMLTVDYFDSIETIVFKRIKERFEAGFKNKNVKLKAQFVELTQEELC